MLLYCDLCREMMFYYSTGANTTPCSLRVRTAATSHEQLRINTIINKVASCYSEIETFTAPLNVLAATSRILDLKARTTDSSNSHPSSPFMPKLSNTESVHHNGPTPATTLEERKPKLPVLPWSTGWPGAHPRRCAHPGRADGLPDVPLAVSVDQPCRSCG